MTYIQEIQKKLIPIFEKNDVTQSSIFGSVAREENLSTSDIDILVKFKGSKSLLDLVRLKRKIENILNKEVDLLTYNSINPRLKKFIDRDEIKIYG